MVMTTETMDIKIMKCIVCGQPTIMKYRKGETEAAFCAWHVPAEQRRIIITISIR